MYEILADKMMTPTQQKGSAQATWCSTTRKLWRYSTAFEESLQGYISGSREILESPVTLDHILARCHSLVNLYLQHHGLGHMPQPDNFTTIGNNLDIEINQYNCPIDVTVYNINLYWLASIDISWAPSKYLYRLDFQLIWCAANFSSMITNQSQNLKDASAPGVPIRAY